MVTTQIGAVALQRSAFGNPAWPLKNQLRAIKKHQRSLLAHLLFPITGSRDSRRQALFTVLGLIRFCKSWVLNAAAWPPHQAWQRIPSTRQWHNEARGVRKIDLTSGKGLARRVARRGFCLMCKLGRSQWIVDPHTRKVATAPIQRSRTQIL